MMNRFWKPEEHSSLDVLDGLSKIENNRYMLQKSVKTINIRQNWARKKNEKKRIMGAKYAEQTKMDNIYKQKRKMAKKDL